MLTYKIQSFFTENSALINTLVFVLLIIPIYLFARQEAYAVQNPQFLASKIYLHLFWGRINRTNFILGLLLLFPLFFLMAIIDGASNHNELFSLIAISFYLTYLLSLGIRRAHDFGNSVFWVFSLNSGCANPEWYFIRKGQTETNKYGPPDHGISLLKIFAIR